MAAAGAGAPRLGSRRVFESEDTSTVAAGVQFVGAQFDDDLNHADAAAARVMRVVELSASRAFGRNLEVFAGVQNLFDAEYFVGTLPTTVGAPRFVSAGFRLRVGGR